MSYHNKAVCDNPGAHGHNAKSDKADTLFLSQCRHHPSSPPVVTGRGIFLVLMR